MKLSVVIPARNEVANIGPTLDSLIQQLSQGAIPYEILVIDDGSTDATGAEVAKRAELHPGIQLIRNKPPYGFGRAIRCGLNAYSGDAVIIYMADGSDNPQDAILYYDILKYKADCAFGSRWMKGSNTYNYPLFKRLVNRFANNILRLMFGFKYNDITNAFKGYRRYVIDGCSPLVSPHFNLTVEIPLKAIVRGYSYDVVPISWQNRKVGESNLKLQEMGSRYLFIVLMVWLEKLLTKGDYRRTDGAQGEPRKGS
jgi:dolichol-phosphate mannosyltransferase